MHNRRMVLAYPGTLSETVKTKLVGDFSSIHGILELVSKALHTRE